MNELTYENRKRIELLYLIYLESRADTNHLVDVLEERHGKELNIFSSPNSVSNTTKYLLDEGWIMPPNKRINTNTHFVITHVGIKQAEKWRDAYKLNNCMVIDEEYVLKQRALDQVLQSYIDIEGHRYWPDKYCIDWSAVDRLQKISTAKYSKLSHFVNNLKDVFDDNDIKKLCLDLNIDYEDIAGDTKEVRIMSLCKYLKNRDRLNELVAICKDERPRKEWSQYVF